MHHEHIFLQNLYLSLNKFKSVSPRSISFPEHPRNTEHSSVQEAECSDIHGGGPALTGFLWLAEEEEDGGAEDWVDSTVKGPGPQGPGRTGSEAQLARRLTKGKNTRRMLSNKPQDFQVGSARVPAS